MYKADNESGVAYGWLCLSIFLIIAGIMYVYLLGFTNSLIDGPMGDQTVGINHDIKEGKQSHQSVNAINFGIAMFTNIPLMLIIGAFLFAITRAITVKGGGV